MAETEVHLRNMLDTIASLDAWFADDPQMYVAGNMLMFYVPGDKRKHVSPDVFVVRGISKRMRDNYLVWEEQKAPDCIVELTSQSTSEEDMQYKFRLYRDVLKVQEYFLFDPHDEYLVPALQGFRLVRGEYQRIRMVQNRLPSRVLGLHLERGDWRVRLYDPATGKLLLVPREEHEALRQVEAARRQAEAARQEESAARQRAEAEVKRLRRELDERRPRRPKRL